MNPGDAQKNVEDGGFPSGGVASYSAMLDDPGVWDGIPTGARDMRWTGFLAVTVSQGKCLLAV